MGGDGRGFEAFAEDAYELLRDLAAGLGAGPNEVEDLVQTGLVAMVDRWRVSADAGAALDRAYVAMAAKCAEDDRLGRVEITSGLVQGSVDADLSETVEERVVLLGLVAGLPPKYRKAIASRYLADLSVAEAAVVLHCSAGAVKSRTHRGLEILRRENQPR